MWRSDGSDLRAASSRTVQRLPDSLQSRLRRLWLSLVPIVQCAVAASLAWWFAGDVLDHVSPFFAPISAVLSLSLSLAKRWRRAVELIGGVTIGIVVGDLLIERLGSGAWQIGVVVAFAMVVAVFLDRGPLVPMQAASSAVLVATLMPPGGPAGFHRAIDAVVGGVIGLCVGALIPVNPARRARRNAAGLLQTLRDLSPRLATALRAADEEEVFQVLSRARGTQALIDSMRNDMTAGREVGMLSPLYWASRPRIERIAATADPIDNAVRNFRVMARRALGLTQRGVSINPAVIDIIDDLAGGFEILRAMMMADPGMSPDSADAARELRTIVRKARQVRLAAGPDLAEAALLAELRSLLVDLLMVAGLKRTTAIAQLRPEK